jgi:hypothetical protein
LILLNDDHAISRPPQGHGTAHHAVLPGRGLDGLDDLRRMGWAPRDHRQALQMILMAL